MSNMKIYEDKLDELMAWTKRRMPTAHARIERPRLGWMPRPSARVNGYYSVSGKLITLNSFKARTDEAAMLEETLPHEFAHHVTFTLFPNEKQAHGPKFREVCKALGITEKAKTLAYTGLKQHRRVKASCPCGKVTAITYTVARRISIEKKIYNCKNCKSPISLPIDFGKELENNGGLEAAFGNELGDHVVSREGE